MTPQPPRLFGIPAVAAPVIAIIRRGPSDWSNVGIWDTTHDIYESGGWMRGKIYPQKCDLSPDGRWLAYSAMKHPGDWPAGPIYEAISRLPWLTALVAWESGTTYTRGIHFTAQQSSDVGQPAVGDATPVLAKYGLMWTQPTQFAVELRRGWAESENNAPRQEGGPWDEQRSVELVKPQPGGVNTLHVDGQYAGFRSGEPDEVALSYWLSDGDEMTPLDDVQWADWDNHGDLLVATKSGLLERRRLLTGVTRTVADLSMTAPEPRPAPAWAKDF